VDHSTEKLAGRLFFAVPLADEAKNAIVAKFESITLPGRPVPLENWHITLRFIGNTPASILEPLIESTRNKLQNSSAFTIAFGGAGAFSRPARDSVLWLAVTDGSNQLVEIARLVEDAVTSAGLPAETRVYNPHLTFSRLEPPEDLQTFVASVPTLDLQMIVDHVMLYRSVLGRGPAHYEQLARFDLRPR
jgi:2'-5' RNA ligase